jgi:hypothetical protein
MNRCDCRVYFAGKVCRREHGVVFAFAQCPFPTFSVNPSAMLLYNPKLQDIMNMYLSEN